MTIRSCPTYGNFNGLRCHTMNFKYNISAYTHGLISSKCEIQFQILLIRKYVRNPFAVLKQFYLYLSAFGTSGPKFAYNMGWRLTLRLYGPGVGSFRTWY